MYVQDDFRVSHKLTMNLGLRYDIYPPWIEVDNLQSNFDETTGQFVVASDNAVLGGVEVGRYLQTYSKKNFGPRFGFAYDVTGNGTLLVRGGFGVFWNFSPGGTSSSKAQNQPFLQSTSLNANPTAYGVNLLLKDGLPAPTGVDPSRPAAGATRSIFDRDFRDAYARQWNLNFQKQLWRQLHDRGRLCRFAGPADGDQDRHQSGAAGRRRHRRERQPSVHPTVAGRARAEPVAEHRRGRLSRPSGQVPATVREQLLVPELVHVRQVDGLSRRTTRRAPRTPSTCRYNRGPSDYDVRHTFSSSWIYELPWARNTLYGGWQLAGIFFLRGGLPLDRDPDAECAVDRNRQPAEPHLRRAPRRIRRSIAGSIRAASFR